MTKSTGATSSLTIFKDITKLVSRTKFFARMNEWDEATILKRAVAALDGRAFE